MIPLASARLSVSSASALAGITIMSLYSSRSRLKFSAAEGKSTLFATMSVGFEISRRDQQKSLVAWGPNSSTFLPTRLFCSSASRTCSSFTPIPLKISVIAGTASCPDGPAARDILSRLASNIFRYHITSSSSMSATSATGSPLPGSAIFPDASMLPEASTICNRASD